MNDQSKYYVVKKTPCRNCIGTGIVRDRGMILDCDLCQARGYFTEEVDLAIALTEIVAEAEAALATAVLAERALCVADICPSCAAGHVLEFIEGEWLHTVIVETVNFGREVCYASPIHTRGKK